MQFIPVDGIYGLSIWSAYYSKITDCHSFIHAYILNSAFIDCIPTVRKQNSAETDENTLLDNEYNKLLIASNPWAASKTTDTAW